jgi:hypothetical protein
MVTSGPYHSLKSVWRIELNVIWANKSNEYTLHITTWLSKRKQTWQFIGWEEPNTTELINTNVVYTHCCVHAIRNQKRGVGQH